jgi:hypothetical protein
VLLEALKHLTSVDLWQVPIQENEVGQRRAFFLFSE